MLDIIAIVAVGSMVGFMLAVQNAAPLSYGSGKGKPARTRGGFTLEIDVLGPPSLIRQVRASNVILGLNKFQVSGEGESTVGPGDGGARVDIRLETARVEGDYKGNPYQFDLTLSSPPDDLAEDPLKQVAWGLGMGGRHYSVGTRGEYLPANPDDDAQGEAMGHLIDTVVRFPTDGVHVNSEWTNQWNGNRRQAENGASFVFEQKARLEEVLDGGPRFRISCQLTGRLDIPEDKNPNHEETTLEAKGSVIFDSKRQKIVASESSGAITTSMKQAGLTLIRRIESRFEEVES